MHVLCRMAPMLAIFFNLVGILEERYSCFDDQKMKIISNEFIIFLMSISRQNIFCCTLLCIIYFFCKQKQFLLQKMYIDNLQILLKMIYTGTIFWDIWFIFLKIGCVCAIYLLVAMILIYVWANVVVVLLHM